MSNKELQEKRIKGFFIEAAKEILKGEGIECANARNIAERAGYSYATLYNYFKDLKELIFECAIDFKEECRELINDSVKSISEGKEKIKAIVQGYINYFVQYPGIFDLFYLVKISGSGIKQNTAEIIFSALDEMYEQELKNCIETGIMDTAAAQLMREQLKYLVTGLLLFYVNRRIPGTYKEFMDICEKQISSIIK